MGGWAKKYYLASNAVMEAALRAHDLGRTQWYVLHQLTHGGPTSQRDLARLLDVERATLTGIVAALVRKGLVEQLPDPGDQRRKVLRLTGAGEALWAALPDPIELILSVAFDGVDAADLATTSRVLREATDRLVRYRAAS